jgi:hypothetical protein
MSKQFSDKDVTLLAIYLGAGSDDEVRPYRSVDALKCKTPNRLWNDRGQIEDNDRDIIY